VAIKTSTKGGISASVNIIYLGTIDPYINLNKSQFEYEYNNIEFFVHNVTIFIMNVSAEDILTYDIWNPQVVMMF
jgi:hypothetical protein